MARKYTSISIQTTLSSNISSTATSLSVASAANLLGDVTLGASDQFAVAIDPDTVSEEIVFVTAANTSTNNLTVIRNAAGTANVAHNSGATVKHVLTGEDLTYFETNLGNAVTSSSTSTLTNKTVNLTSNTLTGTTAQFNTALSDDDFATLTNSVTLTNKTLTAPTITTPISTIGIRTETGAHTLVTSDRSKIVFINSATTANVTINTGVLVQGDIVYICRLGAGDCSIVAGAGTTVNATPGLKLRAQYSVAALLCSSTNNFVLTGDLSA